MCFLFCKNYRRKYRTETSVNVLLKLRKWAQRHHIMRSKFENAIVTLFACGLDISIFLSVIFRYLQGLYLLNVKPIIKTVSNLIQSQIQWGRYYLRLEDNGTYIFLKTLFVHQEWIYLLSSWYECILRIGPQCCWFIFTAF